MLTFLKIRNLALVDELVWELGDGLTAVTGETGAGKSVIVGALKLVLGERADKSLIRTGAEACTLEAVFELAEPQAVDAVLEEGGLARCAGGVLIIRRVIGQGSGRQFVNDSPVTLGLIRQLGDYLVDLHGPHDHQSLLSTSRQLALLDAYAGVERHAYHSAWVSWRLKRAEWEEFQQAEDASEAELDLLRHQLAEIDAAELKPEEEEEITDRCRRAGHAAHLVELASAAAALLGEEGGGMGRLIAELQRLTRETVKLDPSVTTWTGGLEGAVLELQELERGFQDYAADLDIDPAEAERLEERVNLFETLKRKYGPTLEAVLAHRDRCAHRLDSLGNRSEHLDALAAEVAELHQQVVREGRVLTRLRKKFAPELAREIGAQLHDLGFRQASFEINLTARPEAEAEGWESVEFFFGPNPGEPLQPLRQTASSGEISRVMLAVKSALAEQDSTPLMVFDEIDANVGGEIARAVGRKMAALGERHQVVAITHFPQVAAVATRHYVVTKEVHSGRTRSTLFPVEGEERVAELVRMLGGGGKTAREMALSLLHEA